MDLALVAGLPREDSHLRAVVEAKKLDLSCLTAKSQAESYAKGMPDCHRLIVTDGVRYGVYIRGAGGIRCMNVTEPKRRYSRWRRSGGRVPERRISESGNDDFRKGRQSLGTIGG